MRKRMTNSLTDHGSVFWREILCVALCLVAFLLGYESSSSHCHGTGGGDGLNGGGGSRKMFIGSLDFLSASSEGLFKISPDIYI